MLATITAKPSQLNCLQKLTKIGWLPFDLLHLESLIIKSMIIDTLDGGWLLLSIAGQNGTFRCRTFD